jgi:hypothetical protein
MTGTQKEVLVAAPNDTSEGSESSTISVLLRSAEIALRDPLKEVTRRERLYLLGMSLVGITIVWTGLIPQEISTLGITFGEADRQGLLRVLALVIGYFWAAFVIYAASDFLAWRSALKNARWLERLAVLQQGLEESQGRVAEAKRVAQERAEEARKAQVHAEEVQTEEARRAARTAEEAAVGAAEKEESQRYQVLTLEQALREEAEKIGASELDIQRMLADLAHSRSEEERRTPQYALAEAEVSHNMLVKKEISLHQRAKLDMLRFSRFSVWASLLRVVMDFGLPFVAGPYVIYKLLST